MISRNATLVLPHRIHKALRTHLFPGDGLEAAALLLCSRVELRRLKLLAKDMITIPYDVCRRTKDAITWPGQYVEAAIDQAESEALSIIAVHSHPSHSLEFSSIDDASDRTLMPSLRCTLGASCGSAIMIPDGQLIARLYDKSGQCASVDLVMCAGSDISLWWNDGLAAASLPASPMPFTSGMTSDFMRMSACVVGVSGTGSIVAEQLARLGFGEIILIDFDRMELRNLNRILNSTVSDAKDQLLKVEMFAAAIRLYRPDCSAVPVKHSICARKAILAACEADVLFSCVDTAEARHMADRIAAYFAMPLFDVGVSIPTRQTKAGTRGIAEVCGRIDYVFPGGSTLRDRNVYDGELLEAEYLKRAAPETLRQKLNDGYLRGVQEEAPAVISLNMRAASACVMEFIARTFPFRQFEGAARARTIFMLAEGCEEYYAEQDFRVSGEFSIAGGITDPLLGLPSLRDMEFAA